MVRKPSVYATGLFSERMSRDKPAARFYGYEAKFADWATSQGWDVTKRGWPDFICRRDGAFMAVEVKGGADDLSPAQINTLDDLSTAGLPVYVYYDGLGLKRWRGRKSESVANLKAEIGELHALISRVVQARDEMVPGIHPPPSPDWTIQDELNIVIDSCHRRHPEHGRPGTRMTVCSWVYFLRRQERQEWQDIVAMIGEGFPEQIKGLHRKACRVVEKTRSQYAYHAAA